MPVSWGSRFLIAFIGIVFGIIAAMLYVMNFIIVWILKPANVETNDHYTIMGVGTFIVIFVAFILAMLVGILAVRLNKYSIASFDELFGAAALGGLFFGLVGCAIQLVQDFFFYGEMFTHTGTFRPSPYYTDFHALFDVALIIVYIALALLGAAIYARVSRGMKFSRT